MSVKFREDKKNKSLYTTVNGKRYTGKTKERRRS